MGITVELVKLYPLNIQNDENLRSICRISGNYYNYEVIANNEDSRNVSNELNEICMETNCERGNGIVLLNKEAFCKIIPKFIINYPDDYYIEEEILTPLLDFSSYYKEKYYSKLKSLKEIATIRFERLSKFSKLFGIDFPFKTIDELQKQIIESDNATDKEYDEGFTNEYLMIEMLVDESFNDENLLKEALIKATENSYEYNYALFWEE